MLTVIQLVTEAKVEVEGKVIGSIKRGIAALVGLEKTDTAETAQKLIDRVLNYRIFPDENGKMNLSLTAISGGLLLIPQFTLVAETGKGTRPGFSIGMSPNDGKKLFDEMLALARDRYPHVQGGEFGAHMQVSLCNDGPVTFILNSK